MEKAKGAGYGGAHCSELLDEKGKCLVKADSLTVSNRKKGGHRTCLFSPSSKGENPHEENNNFTASVQEYLKITDPDVLRKNTDNSNPSYKRNGHTLENQSESETSTKKAKVQFLEH